MILRGSLLSAALLASSALAQSPAPGPPKHTSAAELIGKAAAEERALDWAAALTYLDWAKTLDSKAPYLWSNYGFIAMRQDKLDDAAEDYRREIANHPAEPIGYTLLAGMQRRQHQTDEAMATLRAGFDRNPKEPAFAFALAAQLSSSGDYAGAEKVLRMGLAAHSGNESIRLRLGDALFNQKKNDEANALFTEIANKSKDPSLLNDAGYNLALIGTNLPLAKKTVRRALDMLEQATHNSEVNSNSLRRSGLVLSNWDSFGWVLFLEGKFDAAAPWIRDAWHQTQHAEIGYHLGMLQEKQGQPADALATYQLALDGTPGVFSPTVQAELKERIAALQAAHAGPDITDAKQQLKQQRTYKTPRLAGVNGEGVFDIVCSNTGVNSIALTQGVHGLDSYTDAVNALKLDLEVPPDSHALITRRGDLICHAGPDCDFILEPTNLAGTTVVLSDE